MDYSTFLTGTTKDELDKLDKLEGDFKVLAPKLIDAFINGRRVPFDNWEYLKVCFSLPAFLIKIIEPIIYEKTGKEDVVNTFELFATFVLGRNC